MAHGRAKSAGIRAIDLFCGAGGSSWGARNAGAEIVAGFDLSQVAGAAFSRNFPEAQFIQTRLEDHSLSAVKKTLGPIDLILASPECTNHSPAKGANPRCEKSRETAFQVVRFANMLQPRWIVIENVVGMKRWRRYDEFISALHDCGYFTQEVVLNAADFGVPQARRRLFLLCDRLRQPSGSAPGRATTRTARSVVDMNGTYAYSRLRDPCRAKATLERAERAFRELGQKEPFLLVYYGSDAAGGWQGLDRPLRTITTLDRFALVKPGRNGHAMRMLQVPELKAAMGMPGRFVAGIGTRREQIRAIGNAVCPPVMRSVVHSLTSRAERLYT